MKFYSSIFIFVLATVLVKPLKAQIKIKKLNLLGGVHLPTGNFASTETKNHFAYYAEDGWNAGIRYDFLLFSKQPDLWSNEKYNKFGAYCPGNFQFLLGYTEVEFFVEYDYAQNVVSPNISNLYKDHYYENIKLLYAGSWKQQVLSIGGKFRYVIQIPVRLSIYAIASIGGGILQAPTYKFSINEINNTSDYEHSSSIPLIANAKLGLGIEFYVGAKSKIFFESRINASSSLLYTNSIKGITDNSIMQYDASINIQSLIAQLGLCYSLN